MRPNIFKLLAQQEKKSNFDIGNDPTDQGPSADYFGETATNFGTSQYDNQTTINVLTEHGGLENLRGERQSNWDKLGNGLVNMGGKAFTTAAEGIINPFYGTIAALTHTDTKGKWDPSFNSYYNNELTQALDKVNKAVEESNPFYQTKEEANAQGLDKLWSFNTIARDVLGGAGTSLGAALTGIAWSKGLSALSKTLAAAGSAEEAAAILAEAKTMGVAPDKLKYIADQRLKQVIKDGAKTGTIALASASGEAGAEAREAEKNILYKLTHDEFGNPKQMTESELAYAEMISKQAGDAAFAMNLPVIMADNWLTFGKALFGNKTNDFAKIIKEGSFFDAATKTYKVVEKGTADAVKYRLGKLFTPIASEMTQEQLQFGIGKTAEDYYVKKYYNPNAADFAESMTKGLAEAYGSQDGWHAGIIGALSSGIASPGIVLAFQGPKGFKDEFITNPNDAIAKQGVDLLNKYKVEDVRRKLVNSFVRSQNISEQKDQAAANKDVFNYQNAAEDLVFQYAFNRLVNGKLDDVYKELDSFKELTPEELKNTYDIDINDQDKFSQSTSNSAVKKFVEERIEKLKQVEKTYKDIDALNPGLHYDIKELLTYSAQGIHNAKNRKSKLAEETAQMLPKLDMIESIAEINNNPNALLTSLSYNPKAFGTAYSKLSNKEKEIFKSQVEKSEDINPVDKEKILINLEDLQKLEEREKDFVTAYTSLKSPAKQKELLEKANTMWTKYAEEETKQKSNQADTTTNNINNTNITEKPIEETFVQKEIIEENPFSIEELEPTKSDSDPNFEQSLNQRRINKQAELDEVFGNTKNLTEVPVGKTVKYKGQNYILNKHSEENVLQLQEINSNKVIDIPLDEEFGYDAPLYYYGISEVNENPITELINIETTGLNTQLITIDNKSYLNMFSNPLNAINYDKNGNIVSVTLNTNDKNKKPRTFKKYAEEVAYAILLETYNKLNNENQQNRAKLSSRIKEETSKSDIERKEQNTFSRNNEESEKLELELKQKEDLAKQEAKEISDYNDLINIALLSESKEELLSYVNELKSNKYYNNKDANKLNSLYKTLNVKQVIVEPTPEPSPVKSSDKFQNVLMTDPSNRDTFVQRNGVTVGKVREKYNLPSFEEIQSLLREFISEGLSPKDYIIFTKDNVNVTLNFVTKDGFLIPVSTVQRKSDEELPNKQDFDNVINFINNTDVNTLNELIQSGVIEFKITNLVNMLSSSEVNNTLDTLMNLTNENISISLYDGNTKLSIEEDYQLTDLDGDVLADKNVDTHAEPTDKLDISKGFHLVVENNTPDGVRSTTVKARLKSHDNAQQLFNDLRTNVQELLEKQAAIQDKKSPEYLNYNDQIRDLVNKFNNEVFFALEPIADQKRHLSIGYRASDATLYFNLEVKAKDAKKYSKVKVESKDPSLKFTNAIPVQDFEMESIVNALVNTNVNPNQVFKQSDIKYNNIADANGKIDLKRIASPLDNQNLVKHGIKIKISEGAKPVQTTAGVITSTQSEVDRLKGKEPLTGKVTSTQSVEDPKTDIERRRKTSLNSIREEIRTVMGEEQSSYVTDIQGVGHWNKIDIINQINAKYDAELARELYKEIKAGKRVTEITVAEQTVANKYITPELRASVDAELAALESGSTSTTTINNELLNDLELLKDPNNISSLAKKYNVPSNLKERKQASEIQKIIESKLKSSEGNEVYSVGFEESTGITNEEIEAVRKILPSFITIDNIKTIAANLRINGIAYGVFKNKVIYLNTLKGKPGTAYHEAFHAVFRTMLNDQQIEKYLIAAQKDFVASGKDIQTEVEKLRSTVKDYENKTTPELIEIALEEHLADKFAEYSQKNKEPKDNILKQLFFIIKNFFNKVFKQSSFENEIDMLFGNILKGSFVNATEISNRYSTISDSVFKLLPKKENAIQNGFFTVQESRKIINTFAIKIHKAKQGLIEDENLYNTVEEDGKIYKELKSDEDLLDYFIEQRVNDLNTKAEAYIDSIYETNREEGLNLTRKVEEELFLYNPDSFTSLNTTPRVILEAAVLDKLSVFDYTNNTNGEESNDEDVEYKDKFGSQDAWLSGGHDSLSRTIKEFVSFTTVVEKDLLTNEDVERSIDDVTLYNGLIRILADTSEENMIGKLYDIAESNPNIKAFYDRIIEELDVTYDPKTNIVTYPTDQYKSNIVRAILTNFKKSKVSQINVLVDSSKKGLKWNNANSYDPANVTLDLWANNLQNKLAYGKVDSQTLSKLSSEIFNASQSKLNQKINAPELNRQAELIKQRFDRIGMPVTTAYIKVSLLKNKAALEGVTLTKDFFTEEQLSTLSKFDKIVPIDFTIFGGIGTSKTNFSINDIFASDPMSLYRGKEADSKLKSIAENNAMFDESIGNFSFTNAEGERVYEIINGSYVLSAISRFKDPSFWKNLNSKQDAVTAESKNKEFIKNNFLLNSQKYRSFITDLKLNILSGFRDTALVNNNSQDGLTFGKFDARTYILSALSLFNNNDKSNSAKYIFRQNEASNTAYVVELPKIDIYSEEGKQELQAFFKNQFTNEFNRIRREYKLFQSGETKTYKKYNDSLKGRAFDFTEFKYLKDILGSELYNTLISNAINSEEALSDANINLVLEAIGVVGNRSDSYLKEGFKDFKNKIKDLDLKLFLDESWSKDSEAKLYSFYVNDYIMSNSMNELLDGDYALSRKDKVDISKRNKSAMASGPDYGKGSHNAAIIQDIDLYTTIEPVDGKLQRVETKDVVDGSYTVINGKKYEVSKYTSNDAQTYSSQYHIMMGSLRLGRLDKVTRDVYKNIIQFTKRDSQGNIVRNINVGKSNQKHLAKTLASLNSKKTIVFDGVAGQLLKMSEIGLVRSSISYIEDQDVDTFVKLTDKLTNLMFKDDFESVEFRNTIKQLAKLYKPIPGMEYWHNLANNMDLNEVDHAVTESASKGATLLPEDTLNPDFDLSKSKFTVQNKNKRLQVETPTGKKEIVFGSQILNIITSEQSDNTEIDFNGEKTTIGKLKAIYTDSISTTRDNSFKKALKVIKEINGKFDKTELDDIVKKALIASNADEQIMQYFEGNYNYNMVQMLVKAEQVVLAHFSKGVLSQKVNGEKVSLVSDAGMQIVYDLETNRVISHHEVTKNPSEYVDKSKYGTRKLAYNVKDSKTGQIYSECMLSQTVLTKHGLKIGDTITKETSEVLQSIGYRIPTGDKQSALSLRVVSLLPDYYQGIGIFPSEIVHLSGADFDIDSEFIQMPYFWYKKEDPTKPIKFGTEKSDYDKFEAFKFYNINYNKDFGKEYKDRLKKDFSYRSIKQTIKEIETQIQQTSDKKVKQDLFLSIKGLKDQIEIIEHNYYGEVSKKFGLPYLQKDFIKSKIKVNASANNAALDVMIELLTNENMTEIANNTTSTEALKQVRDDLKKDGFIKESNQSKIKTENKSAHDVNGKLDANTKNSEGKNGIGVIANKIQQFAWLMSKQGVKEVEFNPDKVIGVDSKGNNIIKKTFKFNIGGYAGGKYAAGKGSDRIANALNILLNVFTDNAKDPIAGDANIKFELLPAMSELIMQGLPFNMAVKFINIPGIQKYGELLQRLNSGVKTSIERNFNKDSVYKAAVADILYGKVDSASIEKATDFLKTYKFSDEMITEKQINSLILDENFRNENKELQIHALTQLIKVKEQYDVMSNINTFLKLNQGLDISFNQVTKKLQKAIDMFGLNELFKLEKKSTLNVEPHINISEILKEDTNTYNNVLRALDIINKVGKKIFIEQTDSFKNELSKLDESLNNGFAQKDEESNKLSKEFLGFLSVRSYITQLNQLKNNSNTSETAKKAIQARLDSIDHGLMFQKLNTKGKKTLARQLNLLKINEATKNNVLVKYLTTKLADDGTLKEDQEKAKSIFDFIQTKSFVKESNETISLLVDSVTSLYYDNTTIIDEETGMTPRDFVSNMFSYLIVKDNMLFKNNSVAKYLPATMFAKYSENLDNLIEELNNSESKFDIKEYGYTFRKFFATDENTKYNALKFKELDSNQDAITVNKSGEVEFNIGRKFELAVVKSRYEHNEYLESEKEELEETVSELKEKVKTEDRKVNIFNLAKIFTPVKVTYEHEGELKKKTVFKFPQFYRFKIGNEVKVYELKKYKSDISDFNSTGTKDFINMDPNLGYVEGSTAFYEPVIFIGAKGMSVYSFENYETAVKKSDIIRESLKDLKDLKTSNNSEINTDSSQQSNVKVVEEPLNLKIRNTDIISGDHSNIVSEKIVEENSQNVLPNQEKSVPLVDEFKLQTAKLKLIDLVENTDLYSEGKLFSDKQYELLKQRINNVKSVTELEALLENINNCMS